MAGTRVPGRWLTWALVASLAVNLLVVGLVAGAILRGPPERPVAAPGLWQYGRALPEPYRRDLGQTLRHSRGDWEGARDALRRQRDAMAEALAGDPFEIARVEALLGEERRLAGTLADRGTALLLEQIARMSSEERADYAAALRERRHREMR